MLNSFAGRKYELAIFNFLWLIIFMPKSLQLVFISLPLIYLVYKEKIHFDKVSYIVFFYILIYIFSVIYNILNYNFEAVRILAASNNIVMWIVALLYYLIYKDIKINFEDLKKISFLNYIILIGVWALSKLTYSVSHLPEITFFSKVLYYSEWYNGEVVMRFVGLMDYANLVVMFIIFFYPLYCLYVMKFKSKTYRLTLILIGFLPFLSTYSRSGYVLILLGVFGVLLVKIYKIANKTLLLSISFILSTVLLAFLIYTSIADPVIEKANELLNSREGSNESRTYLMKESLEASMENSPVIGMGIKVISPEGYPLGSHSTYVGFFYKTGIVGLILGTLALLMMNLKTLSSKYVHKSRYFIMVPILLMPIIFLVEDIDGANWLITFYFIFIGLLNNKKLWKDG